MGNCNCDCNYGENKIEFDDNVDPNLPIAANKFYGETSLITVNKHKLLQFIQDTKGQEEKRKKMFSFVIGHEIAHSIAWKVWLDQYKSIDKIKEAGIFNKPLATHLLVDAIGLKIADVSSDELFGLLQDIFLVLGKGGDLSKRYGCWMALLDR